MTRLLSPHQLLGTLKSIMHALEDWETSTAQGSKQKKSMGLGVEFREF